MTNRRLSIAIFTVLFILPTIILKKLHALRYVSIVCLLTMAYCAIVTILYAIWPSMFPISDSDSSNSSTTWTLSFNNDDHSIGQLLSVLSIFIFAFTCHQNTFAITNELKNPTNTRLNTSMMTSIFVCLIFYLVVSLCVYYTFGSTVLSDMLINYPNDSILVLVVRLVLSINLALSYALQCHPCRMSLSHLLLKRSIVEVERNVVLYYGLTFAIASISFIIAMVVTDLGIILSIVGATGSTTMSYILPGYFYFQMFKNDDKRFWTKYGALGLLVLGCCAIPFTLTVIFVNYFN